jgi:hypothetical protein
VVSVAEVVAVDTPMAPFDFNHQMSLGFRAWMAFKAFVLLKVNYKLDPWVGNFLLQSSKVILSI